MSQGLVDFLLNGAKLIGVTGVLSVAVNGFFYNKFAKENVGPIPNNIDESEEVLASFNVGKEGNFFFGLATAPAHVEDNLDDAWLEFAMETQPTKMKEEHKYPPFGSAGEGEAAAVSAVKEDEEVTVRGIGGEAMESDAEAAAVSSTTQAEGQTSQGQEGVESSEDTDWVAVGKGVKTTVPLDSANVTASEGSGSKEGGGLKEPLIVKKLKRQRSRRTTDAHIVSFADAFSPFLRLNPLRPLRRLGKGIHDKIFGSEEERRRKQREAEQSKEDEDDDYSPNVAAFHNVPYPAKRLNFWSEPELEIRLAQEANQTVYRLGVDWGRIVPREPVDGMDSVVDWEAVKHYRWILELVVAHNMDIMLSLFHHSLPKWAALYGGWKEEKTVKYFLDFVRLVEHHFGDLVKMYVTFNEPHVFAMLTYCAGAWPGEHPNMFETATSALPRGSFEQVMNAMADAHNHAFDILHEAAKSKAQDIRVGISHHVSWMRPYGLFDTPLAVVSTMLTRYAYVDQVCHKCDFIGINYYGQEFACGTGLKLVPNEEYSDSGRGVHPDGLFRALCLFHKRYNIQRKLKVPFIITENGLSDGTDYIRRPYLIEHLLAIRAAMDTGVPVEGYLHWTTSDNWEWADGYGPKFGLVHVDRANNLKRTKRPSYFLYAEISKTGKVTRAQREDAWNSLMEAARAGKKRPFFRQVEANGLMYAGGLDVPIDRPLIDRDWRFAHYRPDGLQDPVSRFFRLLLRVISFGHLGHESHALALRQEQANMRKLAAEAAAKSSRKSIGKPSNKAGLPSGAASAQEAEEREPSLQPSVA